MPAVKQDIYITSLDKTVVFQISCVSEVISGSIFALLAFVFSLMLKPVSFNDSELTQCVI